MKKITALTLTFCMLLTLFSSTTLLSVSADAGSLEIVCATDNGATTSACTAKEAVAGLGSGTSWYSANRAALPDGISKAVFTLKQSAFVDGVKIAFYRAHEREYRFSVEYSMDKREWKSAYEKSWSMQQGEDNSAEYFAFDEIVEALYLQVTVYDARNVFTGAAIEYSAFYGFEACGISNSEGKIPSAELDEAVNWINIRKDLHKDLYTPESWAAFDHAVNAIDLSASFEKQEEVDLAVEDAWIAYMSLDYADPTGIQIAQSHWSGEKYATGSTAWTYGSVLFTEPGYTLDRYKVQNMTLANWIRVFAVPTEEEGVYEISDVIFWGAKVTDSEVVPENEYGTGFILAFYTYNEENVFTGDRWQYASFEFGMRNYAAWCAMELAVGDKVRLNNVVLTAEQFAKEGEEMQAARLQTEGVWKHRYWDKEGLGTLNRTPLYRKSKDVNDAASEDGPQYLAVDEFHDFVTYSTMTKITSPFYVSGHYTYTVSKGEATVTKCDREVAGDVQIPAVIDGYPVTEIAEEAFSECEELTSVKIPEGVRVIGPNAFYSCSGLLSVTVPNSVTSIGHGAFFHCRSLSSVTIPKGVTVLEDNVFAACSSLTSVEIPEGVTSIGERTFDSCTQLSSVTIPKSVEEIGLFAFGDCSALVSVTLSDGVKTVGGGAFCGCRSLSDITFPNSVTFIGGCAFAGCTALTRVTIPENVSKIGQEAFDFCTALTAVEFNAVNCVQMGNYNGPVFSRCTALTTVNFGENVQTIPPFAFRNCSSLSSVTLPNSVKNLGVYAFQACSALALVSFSDSLEVIEDYAFQGCVALDFVTIPDTVSKIGEKAFQSCSKLTFALIPSSVKNIGISAFAQCEGLTISGYEGSAAAVYAAAGEIPFVSLSDKAPEELPGEDDLPPQEGETVVPEEEREQDGEDRQMNTTLFWVLLAVVVLATGGAVTLVLFKKHSKRKDETSESV
ncbi:MAG: leucine-rich repeat protein [Clostridia bacterium]|nr:leucine-rich repeat protein [Clostridia bacterium]